MRTNRKSQAIKKIARELGRVAGAKSMPKLFPHLKEYYETTPYKIPKEEHVRSLLSGCKRKDDWLIILQKIFSVHSLSVDIAAEVEPSLNILGFTLKNGAVITLSKKPVLKTTLSKVRKFSRQSALISESVYNKGIKLADSYLVIYLIENHLRLFIWKIAERSNRKLSKFLSKKNELKIKTRKNQESKNKWLALRKDNDLFYLDIDDLSNVIQSNWQNFSQHFPDEYWLKVKLDEISAIRNRVAHNNSFISEHEKKALNLYMEQLFQQIK